MASNSKGSSAASPPPPPSAWTKQQNKQFERALAVYDTDAPDRWHSVARYMGGTKSAEEVRRHYERLVADVEQIEAGNAPSSLGYGAAPPAGRGGAAAVERSMKYLKLQ
ncbi:protein RADIALIS-like 3 [Oryza brachyantha]|uniref:protein RADIALIS-like 3 n=1 Tax=Oryza brachyantha TaxID=4533 RepID=UPI001ADA8DF3|nr:protein RADIALIS-like 3 [Oryza brachyantha]